MKSQTLQYFFLQSWVVLSLLQSLAFAHPEQLVYQNALLEFAGKLPEESKACIEAYFPFYVAAIEHVSEMDSKHQLTQLYRRGKQIYHDDILYLKKRRQQTWAEEMITWDLSLALSCSSCVVPSFPVFLQKRSILTLQKNETLTTGPIISWTPSDLPSHNLLQTVSIESFWEAFLFAYLAGHQDLAPQNIGIDPYGRVRFFDNEYIGRSNSYPISMYQDKYAFRINFCPTSLDWPQAKIELTRKQAQKIHDMVMFWEKQFPLFQERLRDYSRNYPTDCIDEVIKERLQKLIDFPIRCGTSYMDFYSYLYPCFDMKYHADLIRLGRTLYWRAESIGIALLTLQNRQGRSEDSKNSVDAFIRKFYVTQDG